MSYCKSNLFQLKLIFLCIIKALGDNFYTDISFIKMIRFNKKLYFCQIIQETTPKCPNKCR